MLTGSVKFEVNITPGTGYFEVCENSALVASGRIYAPEGPVLEVPIHDEMSLSEKDPEIINLSKADVYKELRLRGYDYGPTFQGILSASNKGSWTHYKQEVFIVTNCHNSVVVMFAV